jgi:NIPSNAP
MSPLGGFWSTDIGRLNQIMHLWPYESAGERERIRAEAVKSGKWPPNTHEFLMEMESKIIVPAPFSPKVEPRQLGGIYEFRTYTYAPGPHLGNAIKKWSDKIAERVKLSPLVFAGSTDLGPLNQWIHVWAYKDANERARIREESRKDGSWPPATRGMFVKQENMLVVPASFSPLR